MIRTVHLALPALLLACSPQPDAGASPVAGQAEAAARHPVSGLEIVPLKVATSQGEHTFRVEVASSQQEQARGLMFRTELGPDEGMIFPSNPPSPRSFWMKNTPLPLDIIFIGTDGLITDIYASTTPYSLDSLASSGMTKGVLELRGGRAAELGIAVGDRVSW